MPSIPQQQTIVQYVANSSQSQYTFSFYAPLPTDIQVYYQASTATPIPANDLLVLNSGYTVTYNSDPTTGGYITLLFTAVTGYYLTINRQVQASLNTNFAAAQNFNGVNLDSALDRLLLLIQQNLNYILQRNLSYIINTYLPNASPFTQLPPLPQNFFWVGSGSGVVAAQIATIPSASVLQSMLANESPGTDGARLIGYYDTLNAVPQNLDTFLNNLPSYINNIIRTSYYQDTGSVNAIKITVPNYTTYTKGDTFTVLIANTNTSVGATFEVNSIGTNTIFVATAIEIAPYDAAQFTFAFFQYNGGNWILLNPNSNLQRRAYPASVSLLTPQTIPNNLSIYTLINFDTVNFDSYSLWNNTFKRYVAPLTGYYRVNGNVIISHGDPSTTWAAYIFVNGIINSVIISGNYSSTSTPNAGGNGTTILKLNAGDYFDFRMNQGGSVSSDLQASMEGTYFEMQFIGI